MADLNKSLTAMDWLPRINVSPQDQNDSLLCTSDTDDKYNAPNCGGGEVSQKDGKPPYSYANLITLAINSSSKQKMTLSEIYLWIIDNFPYYKEAGNGWKNSIRHNLSLNKTFRKVPRSKDDPGKGSYWAIETDPNDEQTKKRNRRGERFSPYSPEDSGTFVQSPSSSSSVASPPALYTSATCCLTRPTSDVMLDEDCQNNQNSFSDLTASFRALYKTVLETNGVSSSTWDLVQNLDSLRDSSGKSSTAISDTDLNRCQSLMESMKSGDLSAMLSTDQFAGLASSLSQYFTQHGLSPSTYNCTATSTHDGDDVAQAQEFAAQQDGDLHSSPLNSLPTDSGVTASTNSDPGSSDLLTSDQQLPSLVPSLIDAHQLLAPNRSGGVDLDDDIVDDFNWDKLL